ncbi:type ISP restriction/modification enzyme [Streptomyces sp. NPDC003077]|uniref:type ISP restriction/modification enzyme n=1 Tax=Streptomyces sp. NPDC003077 TaxID=3154443 RepID=UPI00339DB8BF
MTATQAAGSEGTDLAAAPRLDDLMPWSVAPLRLGRAWVRAPDAASLKARWNALLRAPDEAARERLFRVSRARTPHSTVAQLPGQATPTGRLAVAAGPCPEPVRVLHGPYDRQWLLPDHRLIDQARPELWRVADARQVFVVEQAHLPQGAGFAVVPAALLPDGRSPAGRPGRVRPLYRRPDGREPNLAPGLAALLARRLDRPVDAEDLLAWIAVSARHLPSGDRAVPLTADPEVWAAGVELGRRLLWLHTYGLRGAGEGPRPRMPGGRRPYVRAALPARGLPEGFSYDAADEALLIGGGRVAPVPRGAWEWYAGGVRVLETWLARRTARPDGADGEPAPGSLEAVRPTAWPPEWTTELLELVTVLALLDEARPEIREVRRRTAEGPRIEAAELRAVGILPVPTASRRPASVLDHPEEGPGGQFALL